MWVDPAVPAIVNGRPGAPCPRTILLAEDDDAVREFVRAVLEQFGFTVVAAADGCTAGDLFAADPCRFDLVLTDVVMPHAVGPVLAARARRLRPGVPVLFMSAFCGGMAGAPEPLHADEQLLEKPFSVADLLKAVNDLLPPQNAN